MIKKLFAGLAVVLALTTVSIAQGAVPAGSIVAFAGTTAPKGWLMCDGAVIPAGGQYRPLSDLIGKNTPDLRGYFLRGIDPTGKVDPDSQPNKVRTMLSQEDDTVGPHTHKYVRHMRSGAGKSGSDDPLIGTDERTDEQTTPPVPLAAETRPKNKAVNFIIKATNN